MKRLRNIGIYYTIFGFLLAISFVFTNLWPISLLGLLLLLTYFFLRFVFKRKQRPTVLNKTQLALWDLFLIAFPFIYVAFTTWYVWRPYNQTIVLPKNYEGVVAIQYDKPNGQEKNWTGGILGIGASRLIKVDTTGMAQTQFKFHNNAISALGLKQTKHNRGGMKIYYENDLNKQIIKDADGDHLTYENKDNQGANIYFTNLYYPLTIFVITKPKNYFNYFMTDLEKKEYRKQQQIEYPDSYIEIDRHELNKNHRMYYELFNPYQNTNY